MTQNILPPTGTNFVTVVTTATPSPVADFTPQRRTHGGIASNANAFMRGSDTGNLPDCIMDCGETLGCKSVVYGLTDSTGQSQGNCYFYSVNVWQVADPSQGLDFLWYDMACF